MVMVEALTNTAIDAATAIVLLYLFQREMTLPLLLLFDEGSWPFRHAQELM